MGHVQEQQDMKGHIQEQQDMKERRKQQNICEWWMVEIDSEMEIDSD